ncbi:MAG TPA: hypothetical protein VLZ33_04020 [Dysgonamonadaceae bacterium]|nr:hypothetical protein [Dysgonamonadaceae bacterium]
MGRTKKLIDELIQKKSNGNAFQVSNVRMKLMFKGVLPDKIDDNTEDQEEIISKIFEVAKDFNITLNN